MNIFCKIIFYDFGIHRRTSGVNYPTNLFHFADESFYILMVSQFS
jgi:hypothetical protein